MAADRVFDPCGDLPTGTTVLEASGVMPSARYVVYFSSDPDWWESIDIDEAMHPQTLVAWGMNGADMPVPFGGPLRLRVPRLSGHTCRPARSRSPSRPTRRWPRRSGRPISASAYCTPLSISDFTSV